MLLPLLASQNWRLPCLTCLRSGLASTWPSSSRVSNPLLPEGSRAPPTGLASPLPFASWRPTQASSTASLCLLALGRSPLSTLPPPATALAPLPGPLSKPLQFSAAMRGFQRRSSSLLASSVLVLLPLPRRTSLMALSFLGLAKRGTPSPPWLRSLPGLLVSLCLRIPPQNEKGDLQGPPWGIIPLTNH